MTNSIIYDGNDFPIRLRSFFPMLDRNDWSVRLYRDDESFVLVGKDDFTRDELGYIYVVPKATMSGLAKGMYSMRIELPLETINISNVLTIRKKTRL